MHARADHGVRMPRLGLLCLSRQEETVMQVVIVKENQSPA
jgi:hypothetical protein